MVSLKIWDRGHYRAAHEEHEGVAKEPSVVVATDTVANVRAVVVEQAHALAARAAVLGGDKSEGDGGKSARVRVRA